jgi:hypothetical protein
VTVCTAQRTVFEDRDSTHEMKRIRWDERRQNLEWPSQREI